jgi:hypothetical protein
MFPSLKESYILGVLTAIVVSLAILFPGVLSPF